jgi:hypothetical protein
MAQNKAVTNYMNRYCIVCGKEWGPALNRCCTETSLVAIVRTGFFKKKTLYYDLNGITIDEAHLAQLRESEQRNFDADVVSTAKRSKEESRSPQKNGESDEVILKCPHCTRIYRIGIDATVVTIESVHALAKEVVIHSDGSLPDRKDMVAALDTLSLERRDPAKREGADNLRQILDSLRRGQRRWWYCSICKNETNPTDYPPLDAPGPSAVSSHTGAARVEAQVLQEFENRYDEVMARAAMLKITQGISDNQFLEQVVDGLTAGLSTKYGLSRDQMISLLDRFYAQRKG